MGSKYVQQTLQLNKFPLRDMKRDSMIGLLGRRGSGKTFILWDIMQKHRGIAEGIVFSGTEDSNNFWKSCIPDSYIFTQYNESIVQALIKRQHRRPKTAVNDDGKPCPPAIFLILDDMIHEKDVLAKSQALRYVFLNGRQSKIMCVIAMQESTAFPPWARLQFDYIFLCHTDSYQELENLYRRYFGLIESKDLFNDIVGATTENFRCLVLDNKPQTRELQKRLFWYKVHDIKAPSHRVGSIAYWAAHDRYYRHKQKHRALFLQQQSKNNVNVNKHESPGSDNDEVEPDQQRPYKTGKRNPTVKVEVID